MALLSEMLSSVGAPVPEASTSKLFGLPAPGDSEDLRRILALPRRELDLTVGPELDAALRRRSTECRPPPPGAVRCPDCKCPLELWPLQRALLVEMRAAGGAMAHYPVGNGKTLPSMLAGEVMGAKNTLLLVPAQVKEKALRFDIPTLRKHWRIPNLAGGPVRYPDTERRIHVLTYEELSSPKNTHFFDEHRFDLIVCDEVHKLRNATASRTKRFLRHLRERDRANDPVQFVALTGTLTKKSIRDYAHLGRYALHAGSPVPHAWPVIQEWAEVLDADAEPTQPPGALLRLCEAGETVHAGFQRRLRQTLGVVIADDQKVTAALHFDEARCPPVPELVKAALSGVWDGWQTPSGEPLQDAISQARAGREIGSGFFYRLDWTKAPPHTKEQREEWLETQKLYSAEVRDALKRAKPGLDSPLLLAQAAHRGAWRSQWYARWTEIKGWFQPKEFREAVWLSDFLLEDAMEWGRKAPGIIWYDHVAWGERLATLAPDFAFYGPGKRARVNIQGERGDRTIIASIDSHGTGKDLQHAFHRNLFANPPCGGDIMQQALGRTHRPGQPKDVVTAAWYWHDESFRNALRSAMREQVHVQRTLGERQKLLLAEFAWDVEADAVEAAA